MTHYENITSMSVDELADFISEVEQGVICEYCGNVDSCNGIVKCTDGIKAYLESEVKENDGD